MIIWTNEALRMVAPNAKMAIIRPLSGMLDGAFAAAGMTNPLEQAHFVAQIAHESAGFRTTTEYATGEAYEGRKILGNTKPGDGVRFKGRGLIQITGRYNYAKYGFEDRPYLAAEFPHALSVAVKYWQDNQLGKYALKNDIRTITKRINGGYNGLAARKTMLKRAKRVVRVIGDDWVKANFKKLGYDSVVGFQAENGLVADGIIGALTRAKIQELLKQREASKAKSHVKNGAGALGVGMAGKAITDAAEQIEPLKEALPILNYVFIGLTLVGVGFVVWSIIKKQIAPEEVHSL